MHTWCPVQRKRWEDNIREWTGLESQRAVENREKWRKLVAKLSVVPQRPSRLRDWWWWCPVSRDMAGLRDSWNLMRGKIIKWLRFSNKAATRHKWKCNITGRRLSSGKQQVRQATGSSLRAWLPAIFWWYLFPGLQELWEKALIHFPSALFLCFFLKWRSACAHQFHFLGQDQCTEAQQAEMTGAKCSLTSFVWTGFPDALCLDSIVSPLWLRWVKCVCIFRCNMPPVLLAEWLESFRYHYSNAGRNGHHERVNT